MENDLSDFDLLSAFNQRGSQEAFALLVTRHANLVYGTARRQVGDPHLAEDVAQAVFVILARKAGQLRSGTILSGWLYSTTLYASANALNKTYASYKNDPQFAMLTIHLSADAKQAKESASGHEWTWPLGAIPFNGGIPEGYGAGPAMIFLIDPAGKVIAKILNSENVDTEIAKAFLERR